MSSANYSTGAGYLQTRVTTASQAELPLMMLDGALRFARQARQFWDQPAHQIEADHLLTRAIDVVEELIRGVTGAGTAISARLVDEYAFAFHRLAAAKLTRDLAALDEAVELLAYHRETWRLVCENLKSQPAPVSPPLGSSRPTFAPPAPLLDSGGLSLEA